MPARRPGPRTPFAPQLHPPRRAAAGRGGPSDWREAARSTPQRVPAMCRSGTRSERLRRGTRRCGPWTRRPTCSKGQASFGLVGPARSGARGVAHTLGAASRSHLGPPLLETDCLHWLTPRAPASESAQSLAGRSTARAVRGRVSRRPHHQKHGQSAFSYRLPTTAGARRLRHGRPAGGRPAGAPDGGRTRRRLLRRALQLSVVRICVY
jgi:hypothetical protein